MGGKSGARRGGSVLAQGNPGTHPGNEARVVGADAQLRNGVCFSGTVVQ